MLTGAVHVAGYKIHIPHAKLDITVFATLSPDMRIYRHGMPFHHLPEYQNPTSLCLSSLYSYPSCFFNQAI